MESKNIKPCNFNVLAVIENLPSEEDGVWKGNRQESTKTEQAYYIGKADKIGPRAKEKDQCPELEEGDYIVFSDLAGMHVPTEDNFCKVIRGHDIVAITTDIKNMNASTVKPTGQRILVEVIKEGDVIEGVFNNSAGDPRSKDTQLGRVVSCAENADQYPEGTIVAFDPWCGNPVVNNDKIFLKTLNSFDIEFTISE